MTNVCINCKYFSGSGCCGIPSRYLLVVAVTHVTGNPSVRSGLCTYVRRLFIYNFIKLIDDHGCFNSVTQVCIGISAEMNMLVLACKTTKFATYFILTTRFNKIGCWKQRALNK